MYDEIMKSLAPSGRKWIGNLFREYNSLLLNIVRNDVRTKFKKFP